MIVPAHDQAQLGGLFSKIGGILDDVGDVLEDVVKAPVKWVDKADQWAWEHMGSDMRQLVQVIGPIVAGAFVPGGQIAAELALAYREGKRLSKQQRHQMRKQLLAFIEQQEQLGNLEEGAVDVDNPDHLEALVLAGRMPADVRAQWFKQRGLAPPQAQRAAGPAAGQLATAGVLLVLGAVL